MTTVSLHEASDLHLFGGKTAALSLLIQSGLPVPSGIAINHRDAAIAASDTDALDSLCTHIETQLSVPLAIRSSAIGEDSRTASFAGVHATYLNVIGREQVAEAICKVHASADSPRALAYRAKHSMPQLPRMGILVQPLIRARLAGVLFTHDPHTHEDVCVIEAARGLGEAVAQGTITPDHYRVDRSGTLTLYRRGSQKIAAVTRPHGGIEYAGIQDRRDPLLGEQTLHRLKLLARQCQAALRDDVGEALDIEWAIDDGDKLWVLQARPITT